mgnify:CR=1 FL=1
MDTQILTTTALQYDNQHNISGSRKRNSFPHFFLYLFLLLSFLTILTLFLSLTPSHSPVLVAIIFLYLSFLLFLWARRPSLFCIFVASSSSYLSN